MRQTGNGAVHAMFKLIPTMRGGSATGIAEVWARYPTVAAARLGIATLLRDDRILRVVIVETKCRRRLLNGWNDEWRASESRRSHRGVSGPRGTELVAGADPRCVRETRRRPTRPIALSRADHRRSHSTYQTVCGTFTSLAANGRSIVKMQPFPGMLRTWMSPAFARTAWRAIASPRPRPERSAPRRSPKG
jgi:hypothetical protein